MQGYAKEICRTWFFVALRIEVDAPGVIASIRPRLWTDDLCFRYQILKFKGVQCSEHSRTGASVIQFSEAFNANVLKTALSHRPLGLLSPMFLQVQQRNISSLTPLSPVPKRTQLHVLMTAFSYRPPSTPLSQVPTTIYLFS